MTFYCAKCGKNVKVAWIAIPWPNIDNARTATKQVLCCTVCHSRINPAATL